jgi:regulatory protein
MKTREPDLRTRALKLLSRREYSRAELYGKLAARTEDLDALNHLLDDLERRNWLSDERFTEQMIHAKRARFGSPRMAHDLRRKGVSRELIDNLLQGAKSQDLVAAREVWKRKFGCPPASREERAKQARFLQARGFDADVIRKVLKMATGESSD